MPLPASVPQAPQRPPATQPFLTQAGTVTTAWTNYFDALDRFNRAMRAYLDSQ